MATISEETGVRIKLIRINIVYWLSVIVLRSANKKT